MKRVIARFDHNAPDLPTHPDNVGFYSDPGRTVAIWDGELPDGWTEDVTDAEREFAKRFRGSAPNYIIV